MGIIADIVEVLEAQKRDESRATPETVIALPCVRGCRQNREKTAAKTEKER